MVRLSFLVAAFLVWVGPAYAQADNELKPVAELKLNATLIRPTVSKDSKFVYFLNKSDGKLQRLDLSKKALDTTEVELTDGTEFVCFTPDGKMAFTCSTLNEPSAYREDSKQSGKVQAIDLEKMKVTATISLRYDPFEIAAPTADVVILSPASGQMSKVVAVDVKKKSITHAVAHSYAAGYLRMTPTGDRLYLGSTGISPGSVSGFPPNQKAENGGGFAIMRGAPDGGPFEITPDGKFAVLRTGYVGRVNKGAQSDLKEAGKIRQHRAFAASPADGFVLVATTDGELVKYSYPDFELVETFTVPKPIYAMTIDPTRKLLIASLDNKQRREILPKLCDDGVGNLAVFDIAALFKKK